MYELKYKNEFSGEMGVKGRMDAINGRRPQSIVPIPGNKQKGLPVLRETKDSNYNVDYGRIIGLKPDSHEILVENQNNGNTESWPIDESIGISDYARKKEDQLTAAAYTIAVQDKIIAVKDEIIEVLKDKLVGLSKENEELDPSQPKCLNYVA